MHIDYDVSFADFLVSMKAYRRRAVGVAIIYFVDVWLLPILGGLVAFIYACAFARLGADSVNGFGWLAIVGCAAIFLPLLYRVRLKWAFKQRTSLSVSGRVSADLDDSSVCFKVGDKAEVKYQWSALTDYSEDREVITIFAGKATLHTLPRRSIGPEKWSDLQSILKQHLKRL